MYQPNEHRYDDMSFYRRCWVQGTAACRRCTWACGIIFLRLTPWHQRDILRAAFDYGITHFDLANNYGPPTARRSGLRIHMDREWHNPSDELVLSTKRGTTWAGPYGDHGSRKYLMAALTRACSGMHERLCDFFYHHRPDPTRLWGNHGRVGDFLRSGKALYVASPTTGEQAERAGKCCAAMGVHLMIHQPRSTCSTVVRGGTDGRAAPEGVG
jgi:L-glyceraldehyde 3-phosphate reductase